MTMSYRRGFDDYYNQPRSRPYSAVDADHFLRKSYSDYSFRNDPISPPNRTRFDTFDGVRGESILKRSPSFDRKVRKYYMNFQFDNYIPTSVDPTPPHVDVLNLETKLASMEHQLRVAQETESRAVKSMQQMRERMEYLEKEASAYNAGQSKAELSVHALQADNRQLQDRLNEFESRLRRQLEERDITHQNATQLERQYEELKQTLCKALFPDSIVEGRSHDAIMRKLIEFVDNYHALKGRLMKLEDNLAYAESELKTTHENAKRLMEDMERTRKYVASTDLIKDERDAAMRRQEQLEDEIRRLESRLAQSHEMASRAHSELQEHQIKLGELDANLRREALSSQATTNEQRAFKDSLAILLSDGFATMPSSEDAIKERIRQLIANQQGSKQTTQQLEAKITQLSQHLEQQAQLHKSAVERARKAELEAETMRSQMKGIEGELMATDLLRDGLKTDKKKYVSFVEQLAAVMKMDRIAKELGVELNGDAVLARAEQLVRLEEDTLHKAKSTQNFNSAIDRQLRDAKKQLETKEMHLDLLRKKLAQVESGQQYKADVDCEEIERENKDMHKKIEQLQKRLHEAKQTVQAMKSESVENKTLKITTSEQQRTIQELERRLDELEQVREKQAKKIAGMKYEQDTVEADKKHTTRVTQATVQSISNELDRMKQKLDDAGKREKQLLDLRHVIARMLGLDAATLAVPDYEIISRLEKMVEAQNELVIGDRDIAGPSRRPPTSGNRPLTSASKVNIAKRQQSPSSANRWKV